MHINTKELAQMVAEGFISKKKHPTEELYIYNYTQPCTYGKVWNDSTIMCRGLILDKDMNPVARPFPKFFNWEELEGLPFEIPNEKFTYSKKMDGSLGILYQVDGIPYIATRGSFISDQAVNATNMLRTKYNDVTFDPELTYMFEIIYPTNRIVLDYDGLEQLCLLGVHVTATGKDVDLDTVELDMPRVETHRKAVSFVSLKEKDLDNEEGFVIKFESGFLMKIKFEEYVRLHRIITGFNEKAIWLFLRDKKDFNEVLSAVPEEFADWVNTTAREFKRQFNEIKDCAMLIFNETDPYTSRKNNALQIIKTNKKLAGTVFQIMDGKDYSTTIWNMLKPIGDKPNGEA